MRFTTTALFAGIFAALAAAQTTQGPDVLIPSGSLDGAYALVDKDKDGKYTTKGEAWDYIKALVNTSPRDYVLVGKKFFFSDTGRDQIVWVEDANGDGLIDPKTERHVYFDVTTVTGTSAVPGFVTLGRDGWLWWCEDGGTAEGIYRSKDQNNDGDAADTGETVAVLTETMTKVKIANTPKTTAFLNNVVRTLSTTEIDSITYDASYGTYGRFIVEDEWSDQLLAFEDKNNDGDFNDTGECYLFCALYPGSTTTTPRTSRIDHDANPDVVAGKLPISNEIIAVAIDVTTKPSTYYLLSGDTTATQLDAGIVYRAQDGNNDGDCNDAGEVTIFWDGSLDSTGATKAYNFCYGIHWNAAGGIVYINAEFDAATDREQLLMLKDGNKDNDANDAGETTVLWDLPVDRTHYHPAILPAGTLSTLKVQTTLAEIRYYGSSSCATSLSSTAFHNIAFGISDATSGYGASRSMNIGNANWLVRTWGAAPSASGAYAISLTKIAAGISHGFGCSTYQTYDIIALNFTTDTAGISKQVLAVPNTTSLLGLWTYWQSIVLDSTAPNGLGLTLSDAFEAKVGDWTYSDS
ncbi:MAG: hypothetical protein ACYTGO_17400 [Planctomycetota bacterium]|jgi:hypothetical protein